MAALPNSKENNNSGANKQQNNKNDKSEIKKEWNADENMNHL